jgi:hypothetical protein
MYLFEYTLFFNYTLYKKYFVLICSLQVYVNKFHDYLAARVNLQRFWWLQGICSKNLAIFTLCSLDICIFGMDFFLPSRVSSHQILFGSLSVFLSVWWHHMYVRQRRYGCRRSLRWDKFRRNWSTSKFKFKGERDI